MSDIRAWQNSAGETPPAWVAEVGIHEDDLANAIPQGHWLVDEPSPGFGDKARCTRFLSPEQYQEQFG